MIYIYIYIYININKSDYNKLNKLDDYNIKKY